MKVVIQHVPGARADTFSRLIHAFPAAEVVECAGKPMETFIRCLSREDGYWHLEDDIILADDFKERAELAVRYHGHRIIRGFDTGYKSGLQPGSSYLYNQCVWIPSGYGPRLADFAKTWKRIAEHPTGFDLVIRDFLVAKKEKYWLESPSLVQHHRGKSLLGSRSSHRISQSFEVRYGSA